MKSRSDDALLLDWRYEIVERMERQTLTRRLSKYEKAEQEEAAWGLVEAAC